MRPGSSSGLAAVLASSLLLAACADRPAPAAPAPDPAPEVALATFEAVVDPAAGTMTIRARRGPAAGDVLPALQPIAVVQDGVPGSGPPDTVELVTTRIGPVVPDGCGPGVDSFEADVVLRSFFASAWLADVHVELTTISLTAHEACNAAAPVPGLSSALGLFHYGTLGAGSPQGAATSRTWRLKLPSLDPFTFTGRVMASVVAPGPLPCSNGAWLGGPPAAQPWDTLLGAERVPKFRLAGDVDGDGQTDLVFGSGSDYTAVVPNQGGALQPYRPVTPFARGIALLDLDRDGRDDLLYGDYQGDLHRLFGQPDATFVEGAVFNVASFDLVELVTLDLDGDGWRDLVANESSLIFAGPPRLHAYRSTGAGAGLAARGGLAFDGTLLATGDLDHDGLGDLLGLEIGGDLQVIHGGPGGLAAAEVIPVPGAPLATAVAAAIGDLDGDGWSDLALVTSELAGLGPDVRRLHRLLNLRNGTYLATEVAVVSPTANGVHLADLDASGTLDAVVTSEETVALFHGDGGGGLGPARVFQAPLGSRFGGLVADVTGDRRPDVIILTVDVVDDGFRIYPTACAP